MQSLDQVSVVSLIQRTPTGDPIPAGSAPANMAINPRSDREYLYVANHSTNTISFLNVRTRQKEVSVASGDRPWDVSITPDGLALYVTNTGDKTVSLIDVESRSTLKNFTFEPSAYPNFMPRGIATQPPSTPSNPGNEARKTEAYVISEGNSGSAGSPAGQIVVLKGQQTASTFTINSAVKLWKGAVTADGNRLLVTDRGRQTLWSVDLTSGAATPITLPSAGWDVVVHGLTAFVSMPDVGVIASIDLNTNTVAETTPATPEGSQNKIQRQPKALAINSNGTELWAALAGSNEVVVIPSIDKTKFGFKPRLVTYSYTPGQSGAPEDIVLGRGVQ
ncbi:Lactonase, 7-bladed beta-propeller [compost metagenome]